MGFMYFGKVSVLSRSPVEDGHMKLTIEHCFESYSQEYQNFMADDSGDEDENGMTAYDRLPMMGPTVVIVTPKTKVLCTTQGQDVEFSGKGTEAVLATYEDERYSVQLATLMVKVASNGQWKACDISYRRIPCGSRAY